MKRWIPTLFFGALLLALVSGGCATTSVQATALTATSTPVPTPSPVATALASPTPLPAPTPFSMIWMSDTQNYLSSFPETLPTMMRWVRDERDAQHTVALLHTGDILQAGFNETQQQRLADAVALLPPGLLCVTAGGNHDRADPPHLNEYYHAYRFDTQLDPAQSISDGDCSYVTFTAGGKSFLVLSVAYQEEKASIEWMNEVLASHPDHYGILLVHAFLSDLMDQYNDGFISTGRLLQKEVVARSPNLRMVLCGHMHGTVYRRAQFDDDGDGIAERTVHELMFNPQDSDPDGDGYLCILTFDPIADTVTLRAYCPKLGTYGIPDGAFAEPVLLTPAGLADFSRAPAA